MSLPTPIKPKKSMFSWVISLVRAIISRHWQGRGIEKSEESNFLGIRAARDKDIRRAVLRFEEHSFHVAVVGNDGSGKSSLIDALRGITAGSGNCALRMVTQGSPTRWPDKNTSNYSQGRFIWHEIPSRAERGIPNLDYFVQQNLDLFDAILVLVDVRLMEYDVGILQSCIKCRIPYIIVRSKSDQHIRNLFLSLKGDKYEDNDKADSRKDVRKISKLKVQAKSKFIKDTRQNFRRVLSKSGLSAKGSLNKVYLVSSLTLQNVVIQGGAKGQPGIQDVIDEEELIERLKHLSNAGSHATSDSHV